jgi:hypothetical protein
LSTFVNPPSERLAREGTPKRGAETIEKTCTQKTVKKQ